MGRYIRIAKTSEIAEGKGKCFDVEGKEIAIFQIDGAFHAIDDQCPHVGGSLSEGFVKNCEVECPWHGARFDLRTGAALSEPASEDVKRYEVRIVGEEIEVEI